FIGGIGFLTQRLQLVFGTTKICHLRLKLIDELFNLLFGSFPSRSRITFSQQPKLPTRKLKFILKFMVLKRYCSLGFQPYDLFFYLLPNVFYTQQVFTRITQPELGFTPTFFIFRYPCSFFEKNT